MKKTITACILLAAMLSAASCASPGSGNVYHTLYTGDGTRSPETVYITLPPETVIITVPVPVTREPDTGTGESVPVTAPVTESPVTGPSESSGTESVSTVMVTMETAVKDLGGGSKATLKYPSLKGLSSETVENKLNSQLAVIAEYDFIADEHCKDYADRIAEGKKVTYSVKDCDVTKITGLLISVRWTAEYSVGDAEPTLLIFTHYMNVSTGKEIKAKDIFSDFGSILTLLENGKMTPVYSAPGFETSTDMAAMIKQYRAGLAYNIFPATYVSGDSLFVAVTAGGTAGGYAEYKIPLSSVSDYLKITF
ncbi:MAG: hypothetical protein MJ137_00995 [Clostridia bacterium]|nr:hypothetical protein [Clostridia bacterium]